MTNNTHKITQDEAYRLVIAGLINGNGSFSQLNGRLRQHGVELVIPKDRGYREIEPREISVKILTQ